jgi:O-antigen/teichoic acid export membrane protein
VARPGAGRGAARATTGRSVVSGGLWYLASFGIPQGYTLVLSVVAARFLGPSGMGTQSFIAFVALSTTSVLSSAVYVALMRFVGETAGRERQDLLPGLLRWAWRVQVAVALAGGAFVAGAALFGAKPKDAWLLAAVVAAAGILHCVPSAVLIGLQRFRQAAVVGLVTGFVATGATVLVLWAGGGVTGMFAVEAVVGILNLLWTGALASRVLRALPASTSDEVGVLRKQVMRFALAATTGVLLQLIVGTRSEFILLEHYSTRAEIAFYSIAFSTFMALRLVPQALGGATAPAFATLFGADEPDRIRSGYSRSARLLLLASLPLAAAGLALGPELIEEIYGHSYASVGRPVQILLLAFPVVALSSLANSLLSGLGQVRLPVVANGIAAAIDVAVAAALIPSLDASGAAAANAAAQGTYAAIVLVYAARQVGPVDWRPGFMSRVVAASVASGLAAWGMLHLLDGFAGVVAGIAVAVAAFGASATILRIVPADDAAWLDESFGRSLHGSVGRLARLWSGRPAATPA